MAIRRKQRKTRRNRPSWQKAARKARRQYRRYRLRKLRAAKSARRTKSNSWRGAAALHRLASLKGWSKRRRKAKNPTLTVFPDDKSAAKYKYKPQIWKVLYAPEEIQAMVPKSWKIRHSTAADLEKYPVTIDQTKRHGFKNPRKRRKSR